MASEALFPNRQPSEEEPINEEPFSSEIEESEDDEGSESQSSEEEETGSDYTSDSGSDSEEENNVFSGFKYPYLKRSFEDLSETMPKKGMILALSKLSSSEAKELDDKWKALFTEELAISIKKIDLMKEQMNMAGFSLR